MAKKILIVGATSAIAQATARIWAERGEQLYLVARNAAQLQMLKDDLTVRGACSVEFCTADLSDSSSLAHWLPKAVKYLSHIDIVLLAHGILGDQKAAEVDSTQARAIIQTNFMSYVDMLTPLANILELQKSGTIAAIGSVGGDRGRAKNYLYGASKAGLEALLSGLRNRLARSQVHVLSIKPGFVDTPMTAHMPKGKLWAQPKTVGKAIVRAIDCRREIIYVPWFWRWIMCVIKNIPEAIFKRMSL